MLICFTPVVPLFRSMPLDRNPCVGILASGHYGTLYSA